MSRVLLPEFRQTQALKQRRACIMFPLLGIPHIDASEREVNAA